jgi:hypothetical protein
VKGDSLQVFSGSKIVDIKFDFKYRKLYTPLALMVAGAALNGNGSESLKNEIVEERNEKLFDFRNHIDDYAQFAPFVALYAFDLAGMEARTNWKDRTAIMLKGELVNLGLVYILKKTLKETRPDGTNYSFPSGHTANVFFGATILSIEYGENYKWVPYASYGVATGVGVMRMANNKHYISDVLFGAGLGMLSAKAAYWLHGYKWNKKKSDKDPLAEISVTQLD